MPANTGRNGQGGSTQFVCQFCSTRGSSLSTSPWLYNHSWAKTSFCGYHRHWRHGRAALSGYLMDCQIWPGLSFKNWFNQFVLYAMFFQSGLLLVGIAFLAMPPHFGWRTWAIAGVLLAILLSLILGLTVKILRWAHMVQPAPVRLHDIAMRAATRAGVKLHIVWVNQGPLANAFALLPMKDMLFSERLVEAMSDEELDSICAHEASHLTESKWVFIGRLSGVLALYPLIFAFPVVHQIGLPGVLMLLMATVALVFLPRQLARRMEKCADAGAVLQAVDPAVYARALEKIYQTNWMPAAMPRRSRLPHPDLYDRMVGRQRYAILRTPATAG